MSLHDLPHRLVTTLRDSSENWEFLRSQPLTSAESFTAADTPGTVVGKIELLDAKGNSLGFIPVYDEIA